MDHHQYSDFPRLLSLLTDLGCKTLMLKGKDSMSKFHVAALLLLILSPVVYSGAAINVGVMNEFMPGEKSTPPSESIIRAIRLLLLKSPSMKFITMMYPAHKNVLWILMH